MIIYEANKKTSFPYWWGVLTILGITGILLLLHFFRIPPQAQASIPFSSFLNDAEKVRNGLFIVDSLRLPEGEFQSSEAAFSGAHAYKIPGGEGFRFGFTTRFSPPTQATLTRLSVWVKKPAGTVVKLVAKQGADPKQYRETSYPVDRKDTWEKLVVNFVAQPSSESIECYVYTTGQEAVFLDDFQLELLPLAIQDKQAPSLSLFFQPTDWQTLSVVRQKALEQGVLTKNINRWVPGKVQFQQKQFGVRARLKGDWTDHLSSPKWSFRVEAAQNQAVLGQTTWSLHSPKARYFLHEWLFHELLRREDILATPYDFVQLQINGQPKGIYAMEGHFTSALLERQNRLDGPILKWDETAYWELNKSLMHLPEISREVTPHPLQSIDSAPLEVFQEKYWHSTPENRALVLQAKEKMRAYLLGNVPLRETFKVQKLAQFLAISDLCLAYHGLYWHNLRFYYDPAVGKFEPIGFDAYGEEPPSSNTFLGQMVYTKHDPFLNTLLKRMLENKEFFVAYTQALYEVTDPVFWQTAWKQLEAPMLARQEWIQQEFPFYHWEPAAWAKRATYLRNLLIPHSLHSLQIQQHEKFWVFESRHPLPIELLLLNGERHSLFPPEWYGEQLKIPIQDIDKSILHVRYRVPGIDSVFLCPVESYLEPSTKLKTTKELQIPPNSPLKLQGDTLFLAGSDTITLRENLVIPANYLLQLEGITLDLRLGAQIEIYGSVDWKKVTLISSDQTGRGVYIANSPAVNWQEVQVCGLHAPEIEGFQLFGAASVVDSKFSGRRCLFTDNQSEDGLYLLRTDSEIIDCSFVDQRSDGLDLDFCQARIANCTFSQNGNDGLDIAGGQVQLERLRLAGNREKGLSIGEKAEVEARNIAISQSPIGLAVKDQSEATFNGLYLKKVQLGIGVYTKKFQFGPANCTVQSFTLEQVKQFYQLGFSCVLELDGQFFIGQ